MISRQQPCIEQELTHQKLPIKAPTNWFPFRGFWIDLSLYMLSANVSDVQYSFLVQYSCRHHKVCTRRTHVCYHLGLFSGNSRCLIFCYILYLCFMFHLQDSIISLRGDSRVHKRQALVSFKKYMPPPLPYFKVNICPLTLPHFASIFFAYL